MTKYRVHFCILLVLLVTCFWVYNRSDQDTSKIQIIKDKIVVKDDKIVVNEDKIVVKELSSERNYNISRDGAIITPIKNQRKLIILLTESRSGSTWLGTMFQFVEDLMYVFEPLDDRFTKSKAAETQLQVLVNLCKCTFLHSIPSFGKASTGRNIKSSVAKYNLAENVVRPARAEEFCRQFDITMAKCIRLTDMSILAKLPELGCDNFQVVHLIRDPRAVIRSRMVTFHELYAGNGKKEAIQDMTVEEVSTAARTMCAHHLHNIAVSEEDWVRDKYHRLLYEDLVYKTDETVLNMFRFIKRPITTSLTGYINKSMHGASARSNFQVIKDSAAVVEKWKSLDKNYLTAIENSCEELMTILDYKKYYT